MSVAILVDVTRCTGCERCALACVETHGRDVKRAEQARATTPDGLAVITPASWTRAMPRIASSVNSRG